MNEAIADVFEQCDIVLCATDPVEPFAAEGPMPSSVDGERVGRNNNGVADDPGEHHRLSGDLRAGGLVGVRPAGGPAGVRAPARRGGAVGPRTSDGARTPVAAHAPRERRY